MRRRKNSFLIVIMDDFFVTKREDESSVEYGNEHMIDHSVQNDRSDEITQVHRYTNTPANKRKLLFEEIATNRSKESGVSMRSNVTHKRDGIRVVLQSLANKYNFPCFITAQSSVGEDLAPLVRKAKVQIFMYHPSSFDPYRRL